MGLRAHFLLLLVMVLNLIAKLLNKSCAQALGLASGMKVFLPCEGKTQEFCASS